MVIQFLKRALSKSHTQNLGNDLCCFSVFGTTGKQPARQQAQGTGPKVPTVPLQSKGKPVQILSSLRDIMMTLSVAT